MEFVRLIPFINLILFMIYLAYMLIFIIPLCLKLKYSGPLIGALMSIIAMAIVIIISFILYYRPEAAKTRRPGVKI